MKYFGVVFFITIGLQTISADFLPYPYSQHNEDDSGTDFQAYNRIRRQSPGGVNVDVTHQRGAGTTVNADVTRRIWRGRDQRVDVTGRYSQTFNGPAAGRPNFGGGATYTHGRFGHIGVNADHTRGMGTSMTARGAGTIWRSNNGNSNLRAEGYYSRGFGRRNMFRPEYGGFVTFTRNF